jgi:hypothetical protein
MCQGPKADWGVTYFTNVVLKVLTPLANPGAPPKSGTISGATWCAPRSAVPGQPHTTTGANKKTTKKGLNKPPKAGVLALHL